MQHYFLTLHHAAILVEQQQCQDEGRDLSSVADEFAALLALDAIDAPQRQRARALFDTTIDLPLREGYPFVEPSDLAGIRAARPAERIELPPYSLDAAQLADKVHGAWAGRSVGCLLGKPVEGWNRERMWGYLRDMGRWPLADFFRYDLATPAIRQRYAMDGYWAGMVYGDQVTTMPEDDDLNYTVTGLALVKQHGLAVTPVDVAQFWIDHLPIGHTATAECLAYRNYCEEIEPPATASYRNPYREWIGAQIRADFWGYVAPGDPALAAELAWRDASISHVKNGIYGAMWVAAMLAAAFVITDIPTIIRVGLGEIPAHSRLTAAITEVLAWHAEGVSYDSAVERLHASWDENDKHAAGHTISNAMVVAIGLLWGEGDYGLSICRAVQPCFDTDCNGATVGSVLGLIHGHAALPPSWRDHIHDTLNSGVDGYHQVSLTTLTADTLACIAAINSART